MEKENKKINITFDGFIAFVCVVLMNLAIGLSAIYYNMRMDDAITVTAECKVVDKYYDDTARIDSYYVVLSFASEIGNLEKAIDVTEESYWTGLKIGDKVRCEIIYDEIGIIDATVLDESIGQHTVAEKRKETLIGLGIVFGVFAVILGFIFFLFRGDGKEEYVPVKLESKDYDLEKRYLPRYRVTFRPCEAEDDEPRDLIIIETSGRDSDDAKDNAECWLDEAFDFEVIEVSEIF